MDRFKFRAWDKHNKGFLPPEMFCVKCNDGSLRNRACPGNIAGVVIMQCTGRKDKNGKLVYEGDILDWLSGYRGKKYEVITENSCSWIRCNTLDIPLFEIDTEEIEIIGNIYEHRGLLNEEGPRRGKQE